MAIDNGNPPRRFLITAAVCSLFVFGARAQDPPARVADLNYINGNVSMQPAGADDWSPAVINRPFTTGDYLWADADSQAELHLNNAVLRLSSQTSVGFLNLDDNIAQIRFSAGEMTIRVRRLGEDETFEVDTPNAAVTLLREGEYRFNAVPDNGTTWVVVRHGQAAITGGGQAFTLASGNSAALSGADQLSYDVQYASDPDGFEAWAEDRDAHEARSPSARYLPPDVIGYENLDNYGSWRASADYGAVWYPSVGAGWAPYRNGHWAWIEPWGWTWVDDAPWGFAPSHYGRWAYIDGGWGWIPGPAAIVAGGPAVAVVYAPALVAFIGGDSWGVSLSFGGAAVGWVPLGPGEVYAPAYHVSQNYFQRVNVANTRVTNLVQVTNVYNSVYVNKTATNVTVNRSYANMVAPNAVTAMPKNAFASGGAVAKVGVSVSKTEVAKVQAAPVTVAPSVAPVKQALAPVTTNKPVMRPPAGVTSRPVVAKVAPPPPPISFAAKASVLQQNAGKIVDTQAMRKSMPAKTVAAAPAVKVAPPALAPKPAPPAPRPTQAAPRPAPPAPRPTEAAPKPAPAPTPRPNEVTPRPAPPAPRPNEVTPRPAPPAPRPNEVTPRPAPPAPRPNEVTPRPAPPEPRPNEVTPRPAPPAPRPNEVTPRPAPPAPQPKAEPPAPKQKPAPPDKNRKEEKPKQS